MDKNQALDALFNLKSETNPQARSHSLCPSAGCWYDVAAASLT
jgi:hypothetical protein